MMDAVKQKGATDQHLRLQLEDPSPFESAAELLPSQAALQSHQKKKTVKSRLFACSCFRPAVADDKQPLPSIQEAEEPCHDVGTPCSVRSSGSWKFMGSPTRQKQLKVTTSQAYSDVDWHDAVSQFSASADHSALMDEVQVRTSTAAVCIQWCCYVFDIYAT